MAATLARPTFVASAPAVPCVPLHVVDDVSAVPLHASGDGPFRVAVDSTRNRVYVIGSGPGPNDFGQVGVFDGATDALITTIPLNASFNEIVADTTNGHVYVSESGAGAIAVIDESTNQIVRTISVPHAYAMAVDPVRNLVWVTQPVIGSLSVIDGSTDTVTRSMTVDGGYPTEPEWVAVNPVTDRVYTSSENTFAGKNKLYVIDGATGQIVNQVFANPPDRLAVDPATNLVYAVVYGAFGPDGSETLNRLDVFSGDATAPPTQIDLFTSRSEAGIWDLDVDSSNGRVYAVANDGLTDYNRWSLYQIDEATNAVTRLPVGPNTLGVAANPATGRIYLADSYDASLLVVSPGPCSSGDATPPTVTLTSPADGAVYNRGDSVVSDFSCADEGGLALTSPDSYLYYYCVGNGAHTGSQVDTSSVGTKSFTVSATDEAGNTTTVTHSYTVLPIGIHVAGTRIVDASGAPLVLRGVNYSGTEYMCVQGAPTPSTHGRGIFENWPNPPTPPEVLASWGINAVRLPLNEDCWLGINGVDPSFGGASYRQAVIDYANALVAHGIVPILELSGSAPGTTLAGFDQQPMPDRDHSIDFWRELATTFRDDGQVVFDLFNEPFPDGNQDTVAAWTCWRDGGSACPGLAYDAVGMQELVNTVRATGAPNLILLGGVQYSRINANWLSYRPSDPGNNLAASWHLYPNAYCPTQACWDTQFQSFVSQAAAVATEIGQGGSAPCGVDFLDRAMLWLDAHDEGYLAWTWDAWGDCFSLIANWGNTAPPFAPTSPYGRTYHDHLLGIPQPPTGVVAAAGNGTAAVSWQAPVDHGSSAINSYRVTPHDQTAGSDQAAVVATGSSTTIAGLTNGHVYTFSATAVNNAGTSASSAASNAVIPQAGYPTPAAATATASTDQTTTVTTGNDPAATGGTSTSVTVPSGTTGGTVTVGQTGTSEPAPIGYLFGGVQVDITAPAASAANPLTLVFTTTPPADQAPPPDPATLASTEIYRAEGTGLPTLVPDCNGAPGQAQPDPCVASRQYVSINGQTDIRLTVLSSSASHWNSARPKAAAVTVSDKGYSPANVTIQPGADVNWAFAGRKAHSVTDNVGLGSSATPLFDSGPKSSGTYRFNFPSSGTFTYLSTAKGDLLSGAVLVPVVATPTSGRTTTAFTVIWSTRGLPGYVFDVQYRFKPAGATGWKNWANWKTGATATSAAFTPGQGAGTYAFHARLRNLATGRASAFSPDTTAVTASS